MLTSEFAVVEPIPRGGAIVDACEPTGAELTSIGCGVA